MNYNTLTQEELSNELERLTYEERRAREKMRGISQEVIRIVQTHYSISQELKTVERILQQRGT